MASSDKSYWLKSGLLSIFEKGSVFIFGFGSIYILTRAFTKAEFGVWVLFYTITSFIEVGRNGLLQNALVKYLSTCEKNETPIVASASLLLNGLLSLCCILFLLLFAPMLSGLLNSPTLSTLLYIYCLSTLFLVPQQQFNFIQQANLDFRGIFWSNFSWKGLFFLYILIHYLMGWPMTLAQLATFQIFTALVSAIVSYGFGRQYLKFSRSIDWQWVSKLFHFGRFVFGTNLSTMLYKTIDKLMLGNIAGTTAVGLYEWAIKITNLVEVPTFSVASVVFPQSARKMETEGKGAVKHLYEKSVGAILALILPFMLFVWVFAEPIIRFLATEAYIDTVPILRVTICFGLFIPFAVQFGTALDSIGRPKVNFRFTLIGLLVNMVLNYIFIHQFGAIGAAYGTLTSYCILFVAMQILLHRMIGVQPLNALRQLVFFYANGFKYVQQLLNNRKVKYKTEA